MLERMTKSKLNNLIKFFKTAGRLKTNQRSGWVEMDISQPESVADHTFRTAILCMVFSDLKSLDQRRMLKMALIHDLPEAIIGDLTPSKKTSESKKQEETAMKQILELLPKKQKEEYTAIWNEYQEGKTSEAKAVRQLEKIEMALQAKEYAEMKSTRQNLNRFIISAGEAVIWPELRRLLSSILEEPQ